MRSMRRIVSHSYLVLFVAIGFKANAIPAKPTLIPFKDSETALYGYKDTQGKIAIPATFYHARSFSEYGIADVIIHTTSLNNHAKVTQHHFRINKNGHIIEQAFYFDNGWDYYNEGLARYVQDGKIGFSNERGEHVIKACFDMAFPFRNGVAAVGDDCKVFIPSKETHCNHLAESKHEYGGQWGVVDKQGNILVPLVHKNGEEALRTLYVTNKAPNNTWIETTGNITKRSYNKKDKMWHYEYSFIGDYRGPDGDYVKITYDHQATSIQKMPKKAKVRVRYIAGDPRFGELLGLIK